jgi:Uma2 family endonuclease
MSKKSGASSNARPEQRGDVMAVEARTGMPLEEFIREYDEAPFELINGEKVMKMPPVAEHSEIIRLLYKLLLRYEDAHATIIAFIESTFITEDKADWVRGSRVSDLMIYAAHRLNTYKAAKEDWRTKPFALVPDVVIEVTSPNDRLTIRSLTFTSRAASRSRG